MQEEGKVCSAIIWDVGGTLLDRISRRQAIAEALFAAGIDSAALHRESMRRAQHVLQPAEPLWRTLEEEEQGFQKIAAETLAASKYASPNHAADLGRVLGTYESMYYPIPGILELLVELQERHIPQVVVSNWPPSLSRVLTHHGLYSFFSVVVGSGEEGILKPDVALFQRALDRLNCKPETAIYIGNDPLLDMLPARSLGMQTIHFDPRRQHVNADAQDVKDLRRAVFSLSVLQDELASESRAVKSFR